MRNEIEQKKRVEKAIRITPAALLSDAIQRIQICLVETRATHHHPIIQSIFHVTTVKALQMAPFLLNYIAVSLLI